MSVRHLAAALFAVIGLAACGSTAATSLSSAGAGVAPGAPLAAPQQGAAKYAPAQAIATPAVALGTTASGSAGPGTKLVLGVPPTADIERSVTAAYTVPAGAFLDSFQGVISRGVSSGGYVVSSTTQPDGSGRIVSGAVTLKVPSAKIADFLDAMPTSFTASSIDFSSVDHTAEFVDVTARLASAHAHLAALDSLLAKATSISDITSLEQEIETVQVEIDTYQGQLNVLTASVDLATATVQLSERGAMVAQPSPPSPVGGGVSGGWNNAIQVTGAVLEGTISALPLLALALAAWLIWRRFSRPSIASRHSPKPTE